MNSLSDSTIAEIAQEIDSGFDCYLHKETLEVILLPNDLHLPDIDEELWQEARDLVENDYDAYILVEPLESRESFKIMERFINTLPENSGLADRLIEALNRKKPFSNFKHLIDHSGDYRQKWFDFKQAELEKHVRTIIELKQRDDESYMEDESEDITGENGQEEE